MLCVWGICWYICCGVVTVVSGEERGECKPFCIIYIALRCFATTIRPYFLAVDSRDRSCGSTLGFTAWKLFCEIYEARNVFQLDSKLIFRRWIGWLRVLKQFVNSTVYVQTIFKRRESSWCAPYSVCLFVYFFFFSPVEDLCVSACVLCRAISTMCTL